ncbi:SUMF1/EgtB/PvdO family nonheme iron enzyme [Scytonema sp. PRP1]|uniref:SUMF1/EgtB/PvdO family nonheme iron enzyme n=1 Tax=Scytonema sp. PRP1 TaxID=3120513 RepID=UPI002FCF623F
MSNPPLLDLFLRLREAGLPLGIDQYHLAVEALLQSIEAGLDIADQQAVARLCRSIWVKSKQQQRLFDQCWAEIVSHRTRLSKSFTIESTVEQQQALSESSSPDDTKSYIESEEAQNQQAEEEEELLIPTPSNVAVVTSVSAPLKEGDYFPIRRKQLRQGWRLLAQKLPSSIPSQLDISATVADVAKRGFFLKPVLTPAQVKSREVILLIDQEGSMVPFHPLCRQLVETWKGAKIYYFHNSPNEELYYDPKCWDGESVKSILAGLSKEHTLVVIVSDAGAARRRTVPSRWEETVDFLAMLTPQAYRVAWLNPLPRFHWMDTTAFEIAKIDPLVPMFALEPAEYQQMLQWLLYGKPSVKNFLAQADQKAYVAWESHQDALRLRSGLNSYYFPDLGFDAQGIVEAFGKQFGEAHLHLAYHAAFPLVLTPDLLYCLWWQFFGKAATVVAWYAVPDLLLSNLCQQVDSELYEMEREVRNELLRRCQQHFGEKRLQELSGFLIEYIKRQVNKQKPNSWESQLLQAQQWTALAYTKKRDEAARKLADELRQAYLQNNKAELVRLSEVIETLAEPLAEEYEPLLVVARGYGALARGDETGIVRVQNQLQQLLGSGETINIEGVTLERPEMNWGQIPRLQRFSFEVVTVNRRGDIIKRETKQARYFTEDLGNRITLYMVAIPGGKFLMGSPEGEGYDSEKPQHEVTVQPFFMGKYPVTQAQWRAVAALPRINRDLHPEPSDFKSDDRPVESVAWYDVVEFCARLSRRTGREYRLPSEAEWEYACRAGTTTPFHFGETITYELANYRASQRFGDEPQGESRQQTTAVGTFPPNAFGLYDMHGNVWEWCADTWHHKYEGAPTDGSAWVKKVNENDNNARLLRGGSWNYDPEFCRSANRYSLFPDLDFYLNGFRVVCGAAARTLQ